MPFFIAAAMMPGDGAVRNGSTKAFGFASRAAAEIGDFGLQLGIVDIAHLADGFRRLVIADRLATRQHLGHLLFQQRIALDIAARPALPAAAEAAHAVADVEEERLALLLAIVADVDAGLDLLVDDLAAMPSLPSRSISAGSTSPPRARRT